MAVSTKSKKALTSIGLTVAIAMETTAGTMPTTDYYKLPQVTDLPDLDFDPDTIETTSYDNLVYKSYLSGLKDTGGIISLPANYTEYGTTMWDDIADKLADTSVNTDGKIAWLVIRIKGTEQTWFIPIQLVKCGIPSAPVNDKVSIDYKFTVLKDIYVATITDTNFAGYLASGDYIIS